MKKPEFPSEEYRILDGLKKHLNFKSGKCFPSGIGDDAVIRQCGKDEQLIFTADTLVENVHFSFKYMSPQEIGYKAIVANLSDCAAMGAQPDSVLIQIVFPFEKNSTEVLFQIYSGIESACKKWNFPVVGGDLSKGPCWMIAVSLTGRKKAGTRLLKRTGIQLGDTVWVTGIPGMSAAGFEIIKKWGRGKVSQKYQNFVDCHITPRARINAGLLLSEDSNVTACIDLSDGISKECYTLCYESSVGMELIPKSNEIAVEFAALEKDLSKPWYEWFLYGGEDYELLFTASQSFDPSKYTSQSLYTIGKITDTKNLVTINLDGTPVTVEKRAWDHFQQ